MLDQQDIKTIEEAVGSVVDKRLDAFAATIAISFNEIRQELVTIHKRIDILSSHVDGFIHLHQKLDQEMTMMHARLDRLEEQLKILQTRLA